MISIIIEWIRNFINSLIKSQAIINSCFLWHKYSNINISNLNIDQK